ncbi:PREDICTED: uncharacterized protein LOC108569673 [Nicrophorus vespilloides]|uniref:Uncharacterized protein LOC108569673 n=1 Tax=Nicrophorus vespilloides TaxID=110193 RepID=A0ABM1NJ00_NICVS|nr:PREDICTED: uncharacterized protein LOC108569673 [Nicrophorus vespilloides]
MNQNPTADWVEKHAENNPLIEMNLMGNKPPIAGPEIDDLDESQTSVAPYPGIDDGFFDKPEEIPEIHNRFGEDEADAKVPNGDALPNNIPPSHPRSHHPFPHAPGYIPYDRRTEYDMGGFSELDSIPDVNVYQHKKTLAQGMMDLALFSANANQLRYIIESYARHPYFYPSVIMISISLLLQVGIGVGLIWNARYNVKDKKEICVANKINNYTVIGIFLVTTINVFISAFGVAPAATTATTTT